MFQEGNMKPWARFSYDWR